MINLYRKKTQDMLEFEHRKGFDRSTTLRLTLRQRISKMELQNIFEGYKHLINWDNCEFLFRKGIEKIQFIYLLCITNEAAQTVYSKRSDIIKKNKLDISIHTLMEDIESIFSTVKANNLTIETTCIVIVPEISSVNSKKIPEKKKRLETIAKLVESSLNVIPSQYKIIQCKNNVTQQLSKDYFILSVDSKDNLEKLYNLQPFNDLLLVIHKLVHPIFTPCLRKESYKNLCLNCFESRSDKCIHDLCESCCTKQLRSENPILKHLPSCFQINRSIQQNTCIKCDIPIVISQTTFNCLHRLCPQCCKLQTFTNKICMLHYRNPVYLNHLNSFKDFGKFIEDYQVKLSGIKLKLIENMKNGDFTWFRPIGNTDVTRYTLDMNKELFIVMDNPNFKRENPLKINDKMYKLFTFQVTV
jgi:hypothetical protein